MPLLPRHAQNLAAAGRREADKKTKYKTGSILLRSEAHAFFILGQRYKLAIKRAAPCSDVACPVEH